MNLNRKQVERLVNTLRRNLLYQTPRTVFAGGAPSHIAVAFLPESYSELMDLIREAGGWTLPPQAKEAIIRHHETLARTASGTYDLGAMSQGDLYTMHAETEGLVELAAFHIAIADEIRRRHETDHIANA